MIALREKNDRHHKVFEQSLQKVRDSLQTSFNSFAADTQRAYQQLRQEIHGDKRFSLTLMMELLEVASDLEGIVAARPACFSSTEWRGASDNQEAAARWAEAVSVESRKVAGLLLRLGIHPYDAIVGAPYVPALHERVGSRHVEGMDALRIAEQCEQGYASQQPEFVLRRPKVIITE
jgi:hypothetical protein